ncbi:short-chain dehydrogenase/reductase SDR [Cupriavidus sp. HMR-1]|nr:short-chain dehydrogenase/reductase SDR [Cupriavidus sp. HMR-1]
MCRNGRDRERGLAGSDKLSEGQSFEAFEKTCFEQARPTSLLKRFTTPEEVTNLVVYVCSQRLPRQMTQHYVRMAVWFVPLSEPPVK